ncbi:transcriptional regulator [Mangrovactinospora gilvigrisea]|uniref:Transcriptional regulator n=1 Tax=Mangrovactinospora gilvigrisea TaxID=1428644 RepID=A0A1J7BTV5_9ACTN|nr:helix-turn-helix transcriptional regulator [Mangrovactinospora gilvigrisea]OIV36873.1 transcriptional regulator [Mangrovactinospora gilvigrisea]
MILLRRLLGDVLRRQRQRQGRTLREVSAAARVSLGYLSEVERGQKEASSELLNSICDALDVNMSMVMREVSDDFALAELARSEAIATEPVREPVRGPGASVPRTPLLDTIPSVTHHDSDRPEPVDVFAA